jgi:hypothetical protein
VDLKRRGNHVPVEAGPIRAVCNHREQLRFLLGGKMIRVSGEFGLSRAGALGDRVCEGGMGIVPRRGMITLPGNNIAMTRTASLWYVCRISSHLPWFHSYRPRVWRCRESARVVDLFATVVGGPELYPWSV